MQNLSNMSINCSFSNSANENSENSNGLGSNNAQLGSNSNNSIIGNIPLEMANNDPSLGKKRTLRVSIHLLFNYY